MALRTRANMGQDLGGGKSGGSWRDWLKRRTMSNPWDMLEGGRNRANMGSSANAASAKVKGTVRNTGAGYTGAKGSDATAPVKSAMMSAATAKKPPMPMRKPKMAKAKAAASKSGFDFGSAIARGFGGDNAWQREKKKAGVTD